MFKKRENWFHSIKRSPFSKNTTERSPLRKIPLKESFRSEKYHSVNFCNEPVILLSIGQSEMSLLLSSSFLCSSFVLPRARIRPHRDFARPWRRWCPRTGSTTGRRPAWYLKINGNGKQQHLSWMALWTCSWALHPPILLRRQAQAAAVAGWQRVRRQPLHHQHEHEHSGHYHQCRWRCRLAAIVAAIASCDEHRPTVRGVGRGGRSGERSRAG